MQTNILTAEHTPSEAGSTGQTVAPPAPTFVAVNAFHNLALPSTATRSQVPESLSSLRRYTKLNISRPSPWDNPVFGPVTRSEAHYQECLARLGSIRSRLEDRLFWFEAPIPVLQAITPAALAGTVMAIRKRETPHIGVHDAALYLLVCASVVSPDLTQTGLWREAFALWSQMTQDDAYWTWLGETEQASAYEPAANEADLAALRSDAMELALDLVFQVARPALAAGNDLLVERAIEIIRSSGADPSACYEFQQSLLGPLEDSVTNLCGEITQDCKAAVVQDDDHADANRVPCERAMTRYRDEVLPMLARLQRLASVDAETSGEFARRSRGQVVKLLLNAHWCWLWTEDYERSEQILIEASGFGADLPEGIPIPEYLESISGYTKRQREIRELILSDKVHRVETAKAKLTGVPLCVCCLAKTDRRTEVRGVWQQGNVKHITRYPFRECQECAKHQQEINAKEGTSIFLGVVPTLTVFAVLYNNVQSIHPFYYFPDSILPILLTGMASLAIAYAIGKRSTITPLAEQHATRGKAVSVVGTTATAVVFEFLHPEYARMFAEFNKSTAIAKASQKYTRGTKLMDGRSRTSVLLTAFAVPVVCFLGFSIANSMGGFFSDDTKPVPPPFTAMPFTHFQDDDTDEMEVKLQQDDDYIKAEDAILDPLKAPLKAQKDRVDALMAQLASLSTKHDALKTKTKSFLSTIRQPTAADVAMLKSDIADLEALKARYKALDAQYKPMLDQWNLQVGQFNRKNDQRNRDMDTRNRLMDIHNQNVREHNASSGN